MAIPPTGAAEMTIRFLLDGAIMQLDTVDPTATLLDHLRYAMGRTGTKEGCAEGDCGACTVVVGEPKGDGLRWRAVNSCIAFLPQLDGMALLTVEGLAREGSKAIPTELHPVQAAMVEHDASQCGFCTPGFVMALFAFQHGGEAGEDETVHEALAGNLCR